MVFMVLFKLTWHQPVLIDVLLGFITVYMCLNLQRLGKVKKNTYF